MIDLGRHPATGQPAGQPVPLPTGEEIRTLTARLAAGHGAGLDDAERIDLIRALEEHKCAAEATQALLTADFDTSQRARAADAGIPAARQGRGIANQIALARRESPHRGQQHLGLARILTTELPHTLHAFRTGAITEWKTMLIARETGCLTLEDRRRLDAEIAADPTHLATLGDGELAATLRARAATLDPASVAARRRRAEADRHTTLRPAPDTMTWLGALLPVKDGVAVHAALTREANRLQATGDPRSRGQIMADTLTTRVLTPHLAEVAAGTDLPLTLNLLVPDTVLLGDHDAGGHLDGYGPVPGDLLRDWIATHLHDGLDVWLRRLYQAPGTGDLVAMDSRARRFTGLLADYLRLRDQHCRTPWCDAPIRHLDHAHDHDQGGPTTAGNGQGLCQACNNAKQAPGWHARPRPGPRHTIETTTPTGHRYRSTAPPPTPAVGPVRPKPRVDIAHWPLELEAA
jgi:hypothetical protein